MKLTVNALRTEDSRQISLPRYVRKAIARAHLSSIVLQKGDVDFPPRGFDIGIAFFRGGDFAAILWRTFTLEQVKKIHAENARARFIYHGCGNYCMIVDVMNAEYLESVGK